jgi:hypothetical protein
MCALCNTKFVTATNWHIEYCENQQEGLVWHQTWAKTQAASFFVTKGGLVLFKGQDGIPHDTIASVQRTINPHFPAEDWKTR